MTKSNIVVYSKPNCMQCNFTKKYLDDKGVLYEIKDIAASEAALEEVRALGFTSVPVINADGIDAFNGFQPERLDQLA